MQQWIEMNIMGMPFEGFGLMGFDNTKKLCVGSWIDSMGADMMIMESSAAAAADTD